MNQPSPKVVRVADVAAVPWRNGGGVTRELVAWPEPRDWIVRVSVADVDASGPFSAYPGVDRWFAVLEGGGLRLETTGLPSIDVTTLDEELHDFPGDPATLCTVLGPGTRDFNLMAQRARARVQPQSLQRGALLETNAECAGLFVAQAVALRQGAAHALQLPAMTCAWWQNPGRERLVLGVEPPQARGWWFEVETDLSRLP